METGTGEGSLTHAEMVTDEQQKQQRSEELKVEAAKYLPEYDDVNSMSLQEVQQALYAQPRGFDADRVLGAQSLEELQVAAREEKERMDVWAKIASINHTEKYKEKS